ncbi:MAG TPA: ATP-binding protein, partial [Labilithrix sp.]|nr:ATP-binding protein [Labilithrix sp.]
MSPVEAAQLLRRDAHALTMLFPVLRQVDVFAEQRGASRAQMTDAAQLRVRGLQALRELFARLADRRPLVVCVDDLQWGDVDSAELFAELIRFPDPPAVCWVMTFREEEATTSPLWAYTIAWSAASTDVAGKAARRGERLVTNSEIAALALAVRTDTMSRRRNERRTRLRELRQ